MFFIVLASDRPGALEHRLKHRQAHLDYWIGQADKVKLAGAMLTGDGVEATPKGSAFILEAPSLAVVRQLLAEDPFTTEGVFGDDLRVEVLRPSLGEWKPG